ncbi:hypothetical protein AG1IA_04267 [Rhizoctonia solani AG-1 IA]|uniref:Uncharacterized protein n=1 Tax=Thanatephorus cucumeris (strain AG1-IA) TaxID=983506 RepID=L8WUN0_THACA|nr:hypothetical protein AG1IA_04267 [Rhizoctonia solani AG-1 IA]
MSKPRGPFRPASQYPADPYAQSQSKGASSGTSERSSRAHRRAPWSLELDALESLSEPQKSAILILGGVSKLAIGLGAADVNRSLTAGSEASIGHQVTDSWQTRSSLDIPQNEPTPEIRLLPIEAESTQEGAARLADIMKSAEKLARQWRRDLVDAGQPSTGTLTRPPAQRSRLSFGGDSQLLTPPATPRMRPTSRLPKGRDRQNYINQQRALDMVINFLPNSNAKGIIKEAILVTTIVKPSLFPLTPQKPGLFSSGVTEPSLSRVPSAADVRLNSRWSRMFSGSRTSLVISNSNPRSQSPSSLAPPMPATPARIIHILPFTYLPPPQGPFAHAHLIRKLEAFLLDFSYSPAAMKLNSNPNMPKSSERLRPFLLSRTGLTETMRIRRQEYTLGDLVIGGLLDCRAESNSRPASGYAASEISDTTEWMTGRAWLGGVADIVLQTPGSSASGTTGVAPSPSSLSTSGTQSAPVSAPSSPQTTVVPGPPRPARSDTRRTLSLGTAEPRPQVSVPVPAITINSSKRDQRASLPTPPESSDSESHANYTEYWRDHDNPSAGTTVSLNDWEGSVPTPPTPGSPTKDLPDRRKSSPLRSSTEATETKKKWWSWGRGRSGVVVGMYCEDDELKARRKSQGSSENWAFEALMLSSHA